MKALTFYQPHASLVALGGKKIETRSWYTSYRGPLAIHAAKISPQKYLDLIFEWPFYEILFPNGYHPFFIPVGCIIAKGELVDCVKITTENIPDEPERSFGDYTPGRFAWRLEKVIPQDPIVYGVRGHQGLWEWRE